MKLDEGTMREQRFDIWPGSKDDFDTQAVQAAPPPVTENHK
jgi:hypothetical protein